MISRREFLRLGGLFAAAALTPSVASATQDLAVEEISIPINGLPPAFESFRIGFISDIHLGAYVPHEWIEDAVRRLNDARPDIILLGGDYIAYRDSIRSGRYGAANNLCFDDCPSFLLPKRLMTAAADLLAQSKAPLGTFAVFGNHDRYLDQRLRRKIFTERGMQVLDNEEFRLVRGNHTLRIVGTEDFRTGSPRLPHAHGPKGENETRVLLTHNPDFLSGVLEKTRFEFDLGLAGHTHGGQIKLPLVGALNYNVADTRFAEGLVKCQGQFSASTIYTTRGIGMVGVPLRINCPAEVSLFTLTRS